MAQLRDFYEVLGVEPDAVLPLIKKAYKKAALQLHPDKNQKNLEEAEKAFKELSNAYTTLQDPQERAWYDSHKDQILSGESGAAGDDYAPDHINLWPYFSSGCFSGFAAGEKSFYNVYAQVFSTLVEEECEYVSDPLKHSRPGFGDADSAYADISTFYDHWRGYVTKKTFAWKDKWNPNEAESRLIRRAIEKENLKERESGKKEHNDLVRNLASHIMKMDRRVIEHRRRRLFEKEEARLAQDQKNVKARAIAQERAKELKDQYWLDLEAEMELMADDIAVVDHYLEKGMTERQRRQKAKQEQEEVEEWYCKVCRKVFKSDGQWKQHQTAKQHKQNMKKFAHLLVEEEEEKEEEEED